MADLARTGTLQQNRANMISRVASRFPMGVRRVVRQTIEAPRTFQSWMQGWRGESSSTTLRVFYGYRTLPRTNELAHGGIIKCQHLETHFPNSFSKFNLLYLVSSRLPPGAPSMVRLSHQRGARVVWNQNGVAYPAWHGPGWERTNKPMASILQEADHVFYQSQFCKLAADRYLGKRGGSWEILYNPVDTRTFTPITTPIDSDHFTLLLAGTQYQWYRIETAIRALAHVRRERPTARLFVTGRLCWIPDERAARRAAEQLARTLRVEDHVTFVGPYTQREAPTVFQQAQVLIHPKYNDPCPSVVLEAMACGLPVVYSKSGGVPELVGDEAGIGVPTPLSWEQDLPPEPRAFAQAILEVAARRHDFVDAARQRAVERFDLQPWLARHREIFERLCRVGG